MKKFANWIWIFLGALYGVMFRFGFELIPRAMQEPMSLAFLVATPFAVGAISIYGLRNTSLRILDMLFMPWLAVGLMLLGTAITFLEGSICIAIMSPLFLFISSIGGLLMGLALRWRKGKERPLLCVAIIPFLTLWAETYLDLTRSDITLSQTTVVKAQPETIWNEILRAKHIRANELPISITHMIGVPKPKEGINIRVNGDDIRFSVWEKGVHFKAKVINQEPLRFIKWHYIFSEDSFPKGSMDEHVAIGGKYFDLKDTAFKLEPIDEYKTRLTITARYKINSSINFYAVPASKLLGNDFIKTILGLYQQRSETTERSSNEI